MNVISFFILPVLSHLLSPEDFGIIGMFTLTTQLFTPIVGLSMNSIIGRCYYTRNDMPSLIGSSIIFIIAMFFGIFLLLLISPDFFSSIIGIDKPIVIVALVASLFAIFNATFLTIIQLQKKPVYWGIITLIGLLLNIGVTFLLIFTLNLTYQARIVGITVASLVQVLVGYYFITKNTLVHFRINKKHFMYFIKLGVPLIIVALSGWGLLSLDKILLQYFTNLQIVGFYVMASTLSSIIYQFINSITMAWTPFAYESLAKNVFQSLYNNSLIIFIFFILGSIILSTLGVYIFKFIIAEKFYISLNLIPIISAGIAISGLTSLLMPYILHAEDTKLLSLFTLISFLVAVGLNIILIKRMGMYGAALGTLAGHALRAIMMLLYVNKKFKVRINILWIIYERFSHKL